MDHALIADETLMAFADGELDAPAAAAVAAAAAADPAVAARIELFRRTRAAVAVAAATPAPEVPEALAARIRALVAAPPGAGVVMLRARPAAPARAWAPLALAAALALAVGLGAGWFAGRAPGAGVAALDPALADALATLPAGGAAADGAIRAIATFTDGAGALCREVEADLPRPRVLIACHDGTGWDVRLAVAAAVPTAGYAPAGAMAAVEAWMAGAAASAPLAPEDEAAALARLR